MCVCHVNFPSQPCYTCVSLCAYMPLVCGSIPERVTNVFRLFDLTFLCPLSSLLSTCHKTFRVYFTLFLSPASFSSLIINISSLSVPPMPLFICLLFSFSLTTSLYTVSVFSALFLLSISFNQVFFSFTLIVPHYIHLTKEILEVSLQSVSFSRWMGTHYTFPNICLTQLEHWQTPTQIWPCYNYSLFLSL